jgi:hypothetical protein
MGRENSMVAARQPVASFQSLAYLTPLEFVTRWKTTVERLGVTNRLDEYNL